MSSPKRPGPYHFTETKYESWLKEGRGQGEGVAYRPFLETRDVRSKGRKHRLAGILHERLVHLMSDLQRNAFLHFEWMENVVDIQEQFPLDRNVTRRIAEAMGIPHPQDSKTGCDLVLTTDLLVTFRDGSGKLIKQAYLACEASGLLRRQKKDRHEIERRYWEREGIRWFPLFENILRDAPYFKALLWIREWSCEKAVSELSARELTDLRSKVLAALATTEGGSIRDFVNAHEKRIGLKAGGILSVLRHLAARKMVGFDPRGGTPTLADPIATFSVPSEASQRRVA